MGNHVHHEELQKFPDSILIEAYKEYGSSTRAGAALGVNYMTVLRAVKRAGIPLTGRQMNGKHQTQEKISNEDLTEAIKVMSCGQIARAYGMSEERVYRRARKLGLYTYLQYGGGKWKRRAERYGCEEFDDTITLKKLIERDKGICQICGKPVKLDDIKNGHARRLYPTLDHTTPLSKGGTHTWDNVQLAHLGCNAGKKDAVEGAIA